MSVCISAVSAGVSEVLIKYTGKYVKIYFIIKITFIAIFRTINDPPGLQVLKVSIFRGLYFRTSFLPSEVIIILCRNKSKSVELMLAPFFFCNRPYKFKLEVLALFMGNSQY